VDASTGVITTVAGSGVTGYLGDGGPATLARLCNDMGNLNFDCNGSLLIADGLNNRVRRVDRTTGVITTVIGTGNNNTTCTTSGTGVLSTNVNLPQALAFDPSGNLYLVEYGYDIVQEVTGGLCPPTPTPTPPSPNGGCDTVVTYSYPNPATGHSMNFLYVLCQPGPVKITVYNSAAQKVANYSANGSAGSNTYLADITSYAHGVYYYLVVAQEGNGTVKSKPTKFAVARAP
jgi:hypothetical protein